MRDAVTFAAAAVVTVAVMLGGYSFTMWRFPPNIAEWDPFIRFYFGLFAVAIPLCWHFRPWK